MLAFLGGAMLGAVFGATWMCLLQINRVDEWKED